MDFQTAYFDELEKIAIGMDSYPRPGSRKDKEHWKSRRNWATGLSAVGLPGAFAARKGRKLATHSGQMLGGGIGGLLGAGIGAGIGLGSGGAINPWESGLAGYYAGVLPGGAIGARLAHGKYDVSAYHVSKGEMAKHLRKKYGR